MVIYYTGKLTNTVYEHDKISIIKYKINLNIRAKMGLLGKK